MANFDFVPVTLDSLPYGIPLNCKLYFKKSVESHGDLETEFVLLCENQTVTPDLVSKLKQTIFPNARAYIERSQIITCLFDNGYFAGYGKDEIEAIKNGESPWRKAVIVPHEPVNEFFCHVKKGVGPAFYYNSAPGEEATGFKKVIQCYDKAKVSTIEMIAIVKATGKVDKVQSSSIAAEVQAHINELDAALILQTINRIRTVDEYLHTHSLNVAYLNGLMGKWLGFDTARHAELVQTGLLHDIGKLMISHEILNKPARLTVQEFDEIKKHPALAVEMLIKSGIRNTELLEGVYQHHEKLNGTGYPQGLNANDICEFGRITSISDIYDAMITKRVYKEPESPFTILNEFAVGGFSELDLKYINTFIGCMGEELKGKKVVLNDGRTGNVVFVNTTKPLHTIIEIDGETVTMGNELYCTKMGDS